jgi:hypothetical protein
VAPHVAADDVIDPADESGYYLVTDLLAQKLHVVSRHGSQGPFPDGTFELPEDCLELGLAEAGLVLSTGLMLQLVESYTWLRSLELFHRSADFSVPLVPMVLFGMSARYFWSVCVQAELTIPAGEIAQSFADAVLEAERAEAEEEREEKRTAVAGWAAVILIVGSLGGVALSVRLPEAAQIVTLMGMFIGLELGALTTYLAKTRPSGSWIWQGLALLVAVGGVIYLVQSFERTEWYLLASVLWGGAIGAVMVVVYLKAVERRGRQDAG